MKTLGFKVGDEVKLKRGTVKLDPVDVKSHCTATIEGFYSDIEGGVYLDRHMGGFISWNVEDLELAGLDGVKPGQPKP